MKLNESSRAGFSLAELLVTLTLFGLMLTALASAGILFLKLYINLENQSEFDNHLRMTSQILGKDARMAADVEIFDVNDIRITRSDGKVIDYYLERTNGTLSLIRKAESGTRILCRNVSTMRFSQPTGQDKQLNLAIELKARNSLMPDSNRIMELTFHQRG